MSNLHPTIDRICQTVLFPGLAAKAQKCHAMVERRLAAARNGARSTADQNNEPTDTAEDQRARPRSSDEQAEGVSTVGSETRLILGPVPGNTNKNSI